MGGITEIIYANNGNGTNINIDFIKSFLKIKYRGPDDTNYVTFSTVDMNTLSSSDLTRIQNTLTRNEIKTYIQYIFILGYHRLSINDTSYDGSQPFENPILYQSNIINTLRERILNNIDNVNLKLICNGEIYNYITLKTDNNFTIPQNLSSFCDVEIILPLYKKNGFLNTLNLLDGDFAFVINENINTFELSKLNTYAVKDFLGIKPLYYVNTNNKGLYIFVSEIKSLPVYIINNASYNINYILPGHYWSFQDQILNGNSELTCYYNFNIYKNLDNCIVSNTGNLESIYGNIRMLITNSVINRFNSTNQPIGILLSGGFNSSLITSILVKYLVENNLPIDLTLFTIAEITDVNDNDNDNSCDCDSSLCLIEFLENKYNIIIKHHIIYLDFEQVQNSINTEIDNIIYHLESFDTKTVKDSLVYNYLLMYVKENTDIKVLLSGDGLDELCGYQQFQGASDYYFQTKSIKLLENMYQFDLLRIDSISNKFSLEIRCPFLQKSFIEYILSIHPKIKKAQKYSNSKDSITKYIIRKSFESSVSNFIYMPENILWRPIEIISNSLSNFQKNVTNYLSENMSDLYFDTNKNKLLNENTQGAIPLTKEDLYYRLIFRKYYPSRDYLVPFYWEKLWDLDLN